MTFSTQAIAVALSLVFLISPLAAAQNFSAACEAALAPLGTPGNPFNDCSGANVSSVIVPDGVTDFYTAWQSFEAAQCQRPVCSAEVQAYALNTITANCSTELANFDPTASFIYAEILQYQLLNQAGCVRYTSNGSYCLPELFKAVQIANGTNITTTNFDSAVAKANPSQFCNDCVKAFALATESVLIWNISDPVQGQSLQSLVLGKCGSTFLNGGYPSTVEQALANSTLPPAPNIYNGSTPTNGTTAVVSGSVSTSPSATGALGSAVASQVSASASAAASSAARSGAEREIKKATGTSIAFLLVVVIAVMVS